MMISFALIYVVTSIYMDMQDTGKPFQAALMMDIPGFQIQVRHNAGYANMCVQCIISLGCHNVGMVLSHQLDTHSTCHSPAVT